MKILNIVDLSDKRYTFYSDGSSEKWYPGDGYSDSGYTDSGYYSDSDDGGSNGNDDDK